MCPCLISTQGLPRRRIVGRCNCSVNIGKADRHTRIVVEHLRKHQQVNTKRLTDRHRKGNSCVHVNRVRKSRTPAWRSTGRSPHTNAWHVCSTWPLFFATLGISLQHMPKHCGLRCGWECRSSSVTPPWSVRSWSVRHKCVRMHAVTLG